MPGRLDLRVIDLGLREYAAAYQVQLMHHEEVLASRDSPIHLGYLLLVEHPPVVTISRRDAAKDHLLASPEFLATRGITVRETDRGGDITYHGPGQLVVYPILDLNHLKLGIHAYMRLLEESVIQTLGAYGVSGTRDATATGVWVPHGEQLAKIAAMGVRVRRWVAMHGLSLNVSPDMGHYQHIVPCGLAGRPVTSMRDVLGAASPVMDSVKQTLVGELSRLIHEAETHAAVARNDATA